MRCCLCIAQSSYNAVVAHTAATMTTLSGNKRSRPFGDAGEQQQQQQNQGERWTHFGGGGGDDDDSSSSLASFAATYEYPLSRYLETDLHYSGGGELRLVLYRINASCVVAPFLEFALTSAGDWPSPSKDDFIEEGEEAAVEPEDEEAEGEGTEEDASTDDAVRGGPMTAATNAAYVLSGAAAENGHFPPRFCGASFGEGRRQYAWFQVDPSVTASPSLVWATVHELVRVRTLRGAALVAETTSFDPRVWHLLDGRGEPVETPMVLEPLSFLGDDGGNSSGRARADGEDEADWVQRMLDREADPANYSPRNEPEHSDHRLVGRTMYSFHDPNWLAFLAAVNGTAASGSSTTTTADTAAKVRRYAVFLEDTLYLVGDCARENVALLDFADTHGLFGSVYLRCSTAPPTTTTTAFIWLIQSTDQFAPLE